MSYHQRQSSDSRNHQARHSSDHSARRGPSSTHGSSDRQSGPRTDGSSSSGGLLSRVTGGIASFIGGRTSETETSEGCNCDVPHPGNREHPSSRIIRDRDISEAAPRSAQPKELQTPNSAPAPLGPLSQADAVAQNDNLKDDPRKKIKDLRARLKKSDENTERLQEQIQHYASRLEQMEKELERQYATVGHLEQENRRLRQKETSLNDQLLSRQSPISLDPFYNQVDQISEAQIIRDGNPSLNGINGAIDDFVTDALEEASSIGHPNSTIQPSQELYLFDSSLLDLLRSQNMTEEKAGYVLDAALHDFIVKVLVNAFFVRPVTPCPNSQQWLSNIDDVFHGIMAQEEWSVSQRWRSVATTNIASRCSPACCDAIQAQTESEILKILSWAFVIPASALDGLQAKLNKELKSIFWDAHQLSTLMKRDFLSAHLTVTTAPADRTTHRYLELHNDYSISVWPSMGGQHGDAVIGTYKLGLDSMVGKGKIKHLVKPEVITDALVRMVHQ